MPNRALTEFQTSRPWPAGLRGRMSTTSTLVGSFVAGEALAGEAAEIVERDDRAFARCDDRDDRLPPTLVSDCR